MAQTVTGQIGTACSASISTIISRARPQAPTWRTGWREPIACRSKAASSKHLAAEVAQDRAALISMMKALAIPIRAYKVYAAWVGEKAGRAKFNGRLLARSPLSDLEELNCSG